VDTISNSGLSKTSEMVIGNCTYIVTTHYKENGRETAEDKLLRYVSGRISAELKKPIISAE
jgi:hypothetical protein